MTVYTDSHGAGGVVGETSACCHECHGDSHAGSSRVTPDQVTVESLPGQMACRSGDGVAGSWSGAACMDRPLFPRVVLVPSNLIIGQQHSGKSPWRESHKHDHVRRLLCSTIYLTTCRLTANGALTTTEIVLLFSPASVVAECEPSLSSPHGHCSSGLQRWYQTRTSCAHQQHRWARGRGVR